MPRCAAQEPSVARSSGRRPTSTPGWSHWCGDRHPRRRRRASRSSPSSTPRSPSAARRCAPLCGAGRARQRRPSGPCGRPASTPVRGARRSASPSSPAWPRLTINPPPRVSVMSPVSVVAPAKLNLSLAVGGPRADGFHDVATVYHAVSLFDEIVARAGHGLRVTIEAGSGIDIETVPVDETNLAAQAAILLAEQTGQDPNVHLHIRKGIPVAGGLAGGSADAAGALVACDALWGTGLGRSDLLGLAAHLG